MPKKKEKYHTSKTVFSNIIFFRINLKGRDHLTMTILTILTTDLQINMKKS
jgi:hypothetical protein